MSASPQQEHHHTPMKPAANDTSEVKLVQHSQIFYWWPVWALAFIFGRISLFGGPRMVLVPSDTDIAKKDSGYTIEVKHETKLLDKAVEEKGFHLHSVDNQFLGVFFCLTLLGVMVITNVPLR